MPEKDRLLMLVYDGTGQPNLIASDDHGKTWSERLWSTPPNAGQPDVALLGLTYLGGGRLLRLSRVARGAAGAVPTTARPGPKSG